MNFLPAQLVRNNNRRGYVRSRSLAMAARMVLAIGIKPLSFISRIFRFSTTAIAARAAVIFRFAPCAGPAARCIQRERGTVLRVITAVHVTKETSDRTKAGHCPHYHDPNRVGKRLLGHSVRGQSSNRRRWRIIREKYVLAQSRLRSKSVSFWETTGSCEMLVC